MWSQSCEQRLLHSALSRLPGCPFPGSIQAKSFSCFLLGGFGASRRHRQSQDTGCKGGSACGPLSAWPEPQISPGAEANSITRYRFKLPSRSSLNRGCLYLPCRRRRAPAVRQPQAGLGQHLKNNITYLVSVHRIIES